MPTGLLLRADLHRLFDRGYLTVTPEHRLEVSGRLREDYRNGHTYYPMHGWAVRVPTVAHERPAKHSPTSRSRTAHACDATRTPTAGDGASSLEDEAARADDDASRNTVVAGQWRHDRGDPRQRELVLGRQPRP